MEKTAPGRLAIMRRFLVSALPQVNKELQRWRQLAAVCPDPELRKQALASIRLKKFHCQGGSVFAIWHQDYRQELIRAIVALQTISDYLDNLCDRAGIYDEQVFRQLHRAFMDAVNPEAGLSDYYAGYPYCQDGGYLKELVQSCQQALASLPSFAAVKNEALRLAGYYCNLQATKHIALEQRRERMQAWLAPLQTCLPADIYWWELAAASGSTLGIFALMALASGQQVPQAVITRVSGAYFPWISGLHILLDYFIDQQEDRQQGDFNFVACYQDDRQADCRLNFFLEHSLEETKALPDPVFHLTVVQGLPAMYLSDAKVVRQQFTARGELLQTAGPFAKYLYRLCKGMRCVGII